MTRAEAIKRLRQLGYTPSDGVWWFGSYTLTEACKREQIGEVEV